MSALFDLIESSNDTDRLRELLRQGEDPNSRYSLGRTPLHVAIMKIERNPEATDEILPIVHELIDSGADVNLQESAGCTPLHLATICRNCRTMHVLLERGAEINVKDDVGWTALHHAIATTFFGRMDGTFRRYSTIIDVVQLLLSYDPDVDIQSGAYETPLMLAIKDKNLLIAQELLKKNASVNVDDALCETVMHYVLSARELNQCILLELTRNGGSFNTIGVRGLSPVDCYFNTILNDTTKEKVEESIFVFKIFMLDNLFSEKQEEYLENIYNKGYESLANCLNKCYHEIMKMRADRLVPRYTVFNVAMRGAFSTDSDHIPGVVFDKVLHKLMKGKYPIYKDILAWGICNGYLRERFAITCDGKYVIDDNLMNYDDLYRISLEMSHFDMLEAMIDCSREMRPFRYFPRLGRLSRCSIS